MKSKNQIISHPSQLNGLSVLPVFRFPGKGVIEIDAPDIDSKTKAQWEHNLNKYYFGCGCDKATVGLLIGIASIVLWYLLNSSSQELSLFMDILISAVVLFLFTAIGKYIGLLLIQRKLNVLIEQIKSKWKGQLEPVSEPWHCG